MTQEADSGLIKMAVAAIVGVLATLVAGGFTLSSKFGKLSSIGREVHEVKTELLQVRKFQGETIERLTRVETLLESINGGS